MAVKTTVAVEWRWAIVKLYRRLFALPMHSAGLARWPYSAIAAIMTELTIGSIIAFRGAAAVGATARRRLSAREPKAGSRSDLKAYRPVAAGRTFAVKALTILALAAAATGGARAVRRTEQRAIEPIIKSAIATGPMLAVEPTRPVAFRLSQSSRLAFEPLTDQLGADQRFL